MGDSRNDDLASANPGTQGDGIEDGAIVKRCFYPTIVFFILNIALALLFNRLVNRPVYHDVYNITDVHAYAVNGLSVASLRAHTNPPGPTSFLWMATAVRMLGGEELRGGRMGIVLAWALLGGGILAFARYSRFPELWYSALLVTLVFPHAVEATATLLTEGPALLFAVLGVLAWTEFASRPRVTPGSLLIGIVGGLALGLSVTCRQYNLALLPAAALVALYQFRRHGQSPAREKRIWMASAGVTLIAAALPVLLLVMVWKGFSSPGMATQTSYSNWQAAVGLNVSRPLIAAFYLAVYLVPLTFPVMARVKQAMRRKGLLIALLVGIVAGTFSSSLLTPGPLRTIVGALSRFAGAQGILLGLIATVVIYNAFALCLLLWEKRDEALSCPPVMFAVLTILFFVAEQVGVGGNIPFYDRYLLIVSPYLGLITFSMLPRLTYPRLLALVAMSVVGQAILWRNAFGS